LLAQLVVLHAAFGQHLALHSEAIFQVGRA
jgi:hypothetical protein